MKGKKGRSIVEAWDALFQENAKRSKPWTDAELIEKMEAEFPKSKGKATTNRPRMYRGCYNRGDFIFMKLGSAKKRGLPQSWQYDSRGEKVEPGTREASIGRKAEGKKGRGSRRRVVVRRRQAA